MDYIGVCVCVCFYFFIFFLWGMGVERRAGGVVGERDLKEMRGVHLREML